MRIRTAIVSSVLALGCIALLTSYFLWNRVEQSPSEFVHEAAVTEEQGENGFAFEIVASPEARAQGLSGRTELPSGYGMLFVFDLPDRYGFWMKDMLLPIDLIWLADDGTILGITENVSPDSYPKPFFPPVPVRLVLETRVGEAAAQGWVVGSRIPLPL